MHWQCAHWGPGRVGGDLAVSLFKFDSEIRPPLVGPSILITHTRRKNQNRFKITVTIMMIITLRWKQLKQVWIVDTGGK